MAGPCSRMNLWTLLTIFFLIGVAASLSAPVKIDVLCDSSGMNVHVQFEVPFNGAIYSKGYANEPNCRYLTPWNNVSEVSFYIPFSRCGTEDILLGSVSKKVNAIIFQSHPVLQTSKDQMSEVFCLPNLNISHTNRKASNPGSLKHEPFSEGHFRTRMELKGGTDPLASNGLENLKVGDKMVIVVYINSVKARSARIKSCEARDGSDTNSSVVKLSDSYGCPLLPIISAFRFIETNTSNYLIAYASMTAFKFSEKQDLYIACVVKPCPNHCSSICPRTTESKDHDSMVPTIFSKRSIEMPDIVTKDNIIPPRKSLNDFHARRVMKDTMKALNSSFKSRLFRRLELPTTRNDFALKKRYLNSDQTDVPEFFMEESLTTEDSNDAKGYSFTTDIENESTASILFKSTGTSQTKRSLQKKEAFSLDQGETAKINKTVTKGFSVSPAGVVIDLNNHYRNDPYCFSPVKFTVVTSCLLFLVLILLIACILLTLNIKRINRNNSVSRFLLYPYD